jgi:hypothetical protein
MKTELTAGIALCFFVSCAEGKGEYPNPAVAGTLGQQPEDSDQDPPNDTMQPDTMTDAGDATGELPSEGPPMIERPLFEAGSSPRIMIVGDSISAGPGCYKGALLNQLTQNGYTDFVFVGSYTDDCGGTVMHSAVSCTTAQQYTQESFMLPNCFAGQTFPGLAALMTTHEPDLVMLQLGVNDAWNLRAVDAILADYSELVRQARAQNPAIVVLVAQIHQIRPECTNVAVFNRAQELVNAVPVWARGESTEVSPVLAADLWTNSDWNQASDCVHPDMAGAERMGLNWYNALSPLLPH